MGKNKFNNILVKRNHELAQYDEMQKIRSELSSKHIPDNNIVKSVCARLTNIVWSVLRLFAIILFLGIVLLIVTCFIYPDVQLQFLEFWKMECNNIINWINTLLG